jgi:hypothetical protein|tara:strand:+ start:64 stop:381 length:318 start_codon:yes stop_codon:yes gene_type:complete
MLSAGLLTALGIIFLLYKVGFKNILGFDILIDIVATIGLMYLFAGTYSGMMAAIIGGLFISVVLIIAKQFINYKKLSCSWVLYSVRNIKLRYPTLRWVVSNQEDL